MRRSPRSRRPASPSFPRRTRWERPSPSVYRAAVEDPSAGSRGNREIMRGSLVPVPCSAEARCVRGSVLARRRAASGRLATSGRRPRTVSGTRALLAAVARGSFGARPILRGPAFAAGLAVPFVRFLPFGLARDEGAERPPELGVGVLDPRVMHEEVNETQRLDRDLGQRVRDLAGDRVSRTQRVDERGFLERHLLLGLLLRVLVLLEELLSIGVGLVRIGNRLIEEELDGDSQVLRQPPNDRRPRRVDSRFDLRERARRDIAGPRQILLGDLSVAAKIEDFSSKVHGAASVGVRSEGRSVRLSSVRHPLRSPVTPGSGGVGGKRSRRYKQRLKRGLQRLPANG